MVPYLQSLRSTRDCGVHLCPAAVESPHSTQWKFRENLQFLSLLFEALPKHLSLPDQNLRYLPTLRMLIEYGVRLSREDWFCKPRRGLNAWRKDSAEGCHPYPVVHIPLLDLPFHIQVVTKLVDCFLSRESQLRKTRRW